MKRIHATQTLCSVLMLSAALWSGTARAEQPVQTESIPTEAAQVAPVQTEAVQSDTAPAAVPVATAAVETAPSGAAAPVSEAQAWNSVADTELEKRGTGGNTLVLSAAELASEVSDNHVGDHSTTGDVNISDEAFSGMHGIGQLTFNTGNNSSVQSNLFVIINVK